MPPVVKLSWLRRIARRLPHACLAIVLVVVTVVYALLVNTPQVRAAIIVVGSNTAGSCVNSDTGSGVSWNAGTLGNTTSSNNSYASITGLDPYDLNGGDAMRCNNFGFSIPTAALSITNIEANWEWRGVNNGGFNCGWGNTVGANFYLYHPTAGVTSGYGASPLPTSDTLVSGNGLWGQSWTPADINSASFGTHINVGYQTCPPGATGEVHIDYIAITVTYTINLPPAAPTLSLPASGATGVSTTPTFTMSTTDTEADYARYEIIVYQSNCSTIVRTIDQSSSQTGWSGQNAAGSTAYSNGSTATHIYQSPQLTPNTTYCWRARAIDPGGRNIYGSYSGTRLFTTNVNPAAPTLSAPTSGQMVTTTTPQFTFAATDTESNYLRYEIEIYDATCLGAPVRIIDQTSSQTGWSGQNAQTSTAYTSGSTATHTYQAPPLPSDITYCWRARAIDPGGSNTWGSYSGTRLFTVNMVPDTPTLISPASGQAGVAVNPEFRLYSSDSDGEELQYRIYIYDATCLGAPVRTISQTSSQTGWNGQSQLSGTAYTSGQTAVHLYQDPSLAVNTTYCWQAQAIDPTGSNTWSSLSPTRLFTVTAIADPSYKVITGQTVIRGQINIGQ